MTKEPVAADREYTQPASVAATPAKEEPDRVVENFDLNNMDFDDIGEMIVRTPDGRKTNWVWKFAGPGHEISVRQSERLARRNLHREAQQEQARVNGKKWKEDEETVDQARERNIGFVVERLLGWSPIKLNGEDYPFTAENAKSILLDRRKGSLLVQAMEYLGDEKSFTKPSAKN